MRINQQIIEASKKAGLDPFLGWLFSAALCYGEEHIPDMFDWGWLTPENSHLYSIPLAMTDEETGKITNRFPLFEKDEVGNYQEFLSLLRLEPVFLNSPENRGKIGNTPDTRQAYTYLTEIISDFDNERLVKATASYYQSTEFSKKLSNFLAELGETWYMSYQEEIHGII